MAIVDKDVKNWFVNDRDEDIFIGLQLPLVLDNGELASTKTTIEAVKQNLLNLCSTEAGERVMQPNLGVRLKRFLFQPFTDSIILEIQNVLTESINYWLPFLTIKNIQVAMSDEQAHDYRNSLDIKIEFMLEKDESTTDSITYTAS